MAYLDPLLDRFAPEPRTLRPSPRFTATELAAIRIGATDCLDTIGRHPAWVSFKRLVFGISPANQLSNDRLEAIRRLVIELRHARAQQLDALIDAALVAGVTKEQASALARRFGCRRRSWIWR